MHRSFLRPFPWMEPSISDMGRYFSVILIKFRKKRSKQKKTYFSVDDNFLCIFLDDLLCRRISIKPKSCQNQKSQIWDAFFSKTRKKFTKNRSKNQKTDFSDDAIFFELKSCVTAYTEKVRRISYSD